MTDSTDPIVGKFVRFRHVRRSSFSTPMLTWNVRLKNGTVAFGDVILFPEHTDVYHFVLQVFDELVGMFNMGVEPLEPDWRDQLATALAEAHMVFVCMDSPNFYVTNTDIPGRWTAGPI